MANHHMPVGKPIAFEGNIRLVEPDAFGFFYCKITSAALAQAPEYLIHPILQRRIKTSGGLRTVAGLGTWEGWIYSDEMDNALKFGYSFEILKGYQFDKGNLFSDYVNRMYALRLEYDKTLAMNLIAKLLLNSLYGKFGMRTEITRVDIYDCSDEFGQTQFKEMLDAYGETVQDYIKIDDNFIIVRDSLVNIKYNEDDDRYHGLDVNIAIASAITSAARVYMSMFKNRPNISLYYSDTDSVVIDAPLPDSIVGSKLGQLKLEHTIEKAVFLAPKVYALIDIDGVETIKVKGISPEVVKELHVSDLDHLLIKDSNRIFTQEKWYKKVIEGEINIKDVAYSLSVTNNKRAPIYINNIFEDTKPYNYDELINKN